ncbi:MAG: hypothetical protein IIA67_06470 [Planctomycetes bacterium]|nr:hypothetical protein [Planctomycetota bacterium]
MKMETPAFARFLPEQVHDTSFAQDHGSLVDITVAMRRSQRAGSLETDGRPGGFRRIVDRTFTHRGEQNKRRMLTVDGQYAMLQAFELSGGEFDSVEADDASADRQSPPPNRADPPPQPAAGPAEGDVSQAAPASYQREETARLADVHIEESRKADKMTRVDPPVTFSPQPIGRSPHAALFEQLGDNRASDLFGPAAYLNLGRKSGIAPAMLVLAGGQLLLGASWRSRRRLMHEPSVELPLRG